MTLDVVDDLGHDVAVGARHDQARTLRRTGDVLADPDVATLDGSALVRVALGDLYTVCHGLLTRLSDLAADDFALVLDALGLVRVGLAQLADVGRNLADLLLVDALDGELRRVLDLEGDALGGLDQDRVAVAQRELQVGALRQDAVTDTADLELLARNPWSRR